MKNLATVEEVFAALGGVKPVSVLTHTKYNATHNWKVNGQFPSRTYKILTDHLASLGFRAPPELWGMM